MKNKNIKQNLTGLSLPMDEQETIINRVRSEKNDLVIYTTDSRVIRKCLKHYKEYITEKNYNSSYIGVDGKGLIELRLVIPCIKFKKTILLPNYKGDSTQSIGKEKQSVQNEYFNTSESSNAKSVKV